MYLLTAKGMPWVITDCMPLGSKSGCRGLFEGLHASGWRVRPVFTSRLRRGVCTRR